MRTKQFHQNYFRFIILDEFLFLSFAIFLLPRVSVETQIQTQHTGVYSRCARRTRASVCKPERDVKEIKKRGERKREGGGGEKTKERERNEGG